MQAFDFARPVFFFRIDFVGAGFVWVNVVAIGAPACRLAGDGRLEAFGPILIAVQGGFRGQFAVYGEMQAGAFGE